MALQKQPVSINFIKGLDTKTDPYQVQIGSFLTLVNSVFTTSGRLTKRNGFSTITSLPNVNQTTITTFNDNLIVTGSNLYAFSEDTDQWLNQGIIQPVQLSVQPLIRVSTSQESPTTAIANNGLVLLTYTDSGVSYYQISDINTGQQIVKRQLLPNSAINPRAFILKNYFIITFAANISSVSTLQYIAIPINNPNMVNPPVNISADLKSQNTGYDAYFVPNNNNLYIAWGGSTSVNIVFLTSQLSLSSVIPITGAASTLMSLVSDPINQRVYVSYWDSSSTNGYSASFNYSLVPIMTPTQIITTTEIAEITSIVSIGILNIFYENINFYDSTSPDPDTARTDFISTLTVISPITPPAAGTISSTTIVLRSVGLASKAFISDSGIIYMMVAYGDVNNTNSIDNSNQATYFLIDNTGVVYMRLAYSNGGGYAASQVLPNINLFNNSYNFPYQYADFLTTVNKNVQLPSGTPTSAIYTQYGINLATFSLNTNGQHSSEIAGALHLTGGLLWEYDGVKPVEHGFNVWPENIAVSPLMMGGGLTPQLYNYVFTYEWTDNQGNLHRSAPSIPLVITNTSTPVIFTSSFASGVSSITVSSTTGLQVGQYLTDTTTSANIQALTYITNIVGSTVFLSLPTAGIGSTDTLQTIDTASNTLYVPTLRITYKQPFISPPNIAVTNPVRIVGYRWSVAQQVFYQFTSITDPYINDTTIDYVTIIDTNSDLQILGQTILYTTGGVVEDICAPASIDSTLFDNRLWLIDAEDNNLLWYSKQVIEAVPVEMSDLLTLYIAPTTGAQGSTGAMTAIFPMDDKLIIFKKDAAYYINGTGPDNTGSNSTYSQTIFITAAVGCSNPDSIVLIPNGLMFQSDKGIWLLGRDLSTTYIGASVEQYNSATVVSSAAIPGTTQVRFVLNNNITLMYDYYFNEWATHTNIAAISATLYQNMHTYLNSYGQVFQESENLFLDGSTPVLMSLTTSWINVAGLQGYERFYFANLLGTYYTPFILDVGFAYNYNSSTIQQIQVLPENYVANWGGEAQWGSGSDWGGPGNVFSARVFPEKQKCQSFQMTLQEVYDSSLGQAAGQGLTLSGLLLTIGIKKGNRTQSAAKSFG